MLHELFDTFYSKLALSFYRNAAQYQSREEFEKLSSIEMTTLEMVYLLGNPTCKELSESLNISTPNMAYRINRLAAKGYLTRQQDSRDRRSYRLALTDRFMEYYCVNDAFIAAVAQRTKERFPREEVARFEEMLQIITKELMN